MKPAKSADRLFEIVEAIVGWAKGQGVVVFYGWAHGDNQKTVYWNEERGGDWQKFLECAIAVEAKVVYLNWAAFEEFQIDEAIGHLGEIAAAERGLGIEQQSSLPSSQELEAYRDKVGATAIIDLAFIHQDVVHIYECSADWFRSFEELTDGFEADSDETEDSFSERLVDKALVKKWASELANHPKFGTTRTGDQREFLLESIAGSEIDGLPVGDILARADSIYQFDIKPKKEEHLRAEVRRLREQGLNINAISVKLGISKDRVSGLLSG